MLTVVALAIQLFTVGSWASASTSILGANFLKCQWVDKDAKKFAADLTLASRSPTELVYAAKQLVDGKPVTTTVEVTAQISLRSTIININPVIGNFKAKNYELYQATATSVTFQASNFGTDFFTCATGTTKVVR